MSESTRKRVIEAIRNGVRRLCLLGGHGGLCVVYFVHDPVFGVLYALVLLSHILESTERK